MLPRPFFAAPQSMLEVLTDDWPRLGESLLRSLWLLVPAYLLGASTGFRTGVAVGWSRIVGYWVHPVLRIIGPVPAVAWIPVAFFVLPSSRSASTFLMQAELVRIWQDRGFTALLVTHDVEEALLLANRVIVVSDRPARIRADLKVELSYPRHRNDPEIVRLRRDVLGQLGLTS